MAQNQKASKKKNMTPEREKIIRKAKKKRKAGRLYDFLAVLIVFLAFYIVFSLFVCAFVIYSFNDTAKNSDFYSLSVIYDENELFDLSSEEANNEYGLYVPFSYLAEISSFGLAGDGDDITLYIIGTSNRIECTRNSSLIIINDNPVRISAPLLFDDESNEYLIPISLLENYVNGIEVSYDNEEMVCSISSDVSKADISLSLRLPESMTAANFPDSYKYYTSNDTSDDGSVEPNAS